MITHPDTSSFSFIARKNITQGEELCIEYGRASNLEFMVRYGFRTEDNYYGGRQFDLEGESSQSICPSIILRHDDEIVEPEVLDCHRRARHKAFSQIVGTPEVTDLMEEDRSIYRAISDACMSLIPVTSQLQHLEENEDDDDLSLALIQEIRTEIRLAQRCSKTYDTMAKQNTFRPLTPERITVQAYVNRTEEL